MDVKDIKDLILTIDKTSVESVEIEKGDFVIRVSKKSKIESNTTQKINEAITLDKVKEVNRELEVGNEDNAKYIQEIEDLHIIKSPMVGTFYGAPSPDSAPFVKVGDKVEKGQTLCIVEAMKMMNEIKSDIAGEIVEILAEAEDIVEYGQPLMRIRR
ncbi:acetyl-CoA carboxylase biotin carboxyl carrier protein [Serpentinicella alkaliphila]|uniref:Biotin carboxyl carrier protein of acetyl-CoA carboxylase n=1 Tax=Serpentinicella alkaliphila TaxID=1734049 RepID=A0A4R2TF17_9FIRM|nr:acetyl-CoA carboxylase biotin carboxyl carrier protein [Serpentinicella alkaliphila]QUH25883.1 acetyl-CoA carboxylase biotin carboxyl carrier protein [Serpentinicella alkaliphila]TCQ01948.1 acetyl-CoA carboxylase biotin carboxyl carrier protein [Serpentinicella alkaliphila]